MSDKFKGYGVRVELKDAETFNIIRETLTRIGIASYKNKSLTQSCHIFHKQGEYTIMHFKEMLAYDGKTSDIPDDDLARRNTIVNLLREWGLIKILDNEFDKQPALSMTEIKVISAREKADWKLQQKYTIGKKAY